MENTGFFVALSITLLSGVDYEDGVKLICSDDSVDKTNNLAIWAAITNFIAVSSILCFLLGDKGGVISVTGQLFYLCNSLSMIILFVMA